MRRIFACSEYSGTAAIRMAAEYVIITSEKKPCGARDHSNCLEPTPDLSEAFVWLGRSGVVRRQGSESVGLGSCEDRVKTFVTRHCGDTDRARQKSRLFF